MNDFPGGIPQDAIDYLAAEWGIDYAQWSDLDAFHKLVVVAAVQQSVSRDAAAKMSVLESQTAVILATLEDQRLPPDPEPGLAGLDNPVGASGDPDGADVWPPHWVDANPMGTLYTFSGGTRQARHTGADLNLNHPHWDADRHTPVYAIGDGRVTCARRLGGSWGNVVVVRHDSPAVYSRYAHLDNMTVSEGDTVVRGQRVGRVGDSFGQFPFHLHFDISLTAVLGDNPGHWPGTDLAAVVTHYVEPRSFILLSRPGATPDVGEGVATSGAVNFRTGPSTRFAIYQTLERGTAVTRLALLDDWALCQMDSGEYGWMHNPLLRPL